MSKNMSKLLALILAAATFIMAFAGCSGTVADSSKPAEESTSVNQSESSEASESI